MNIDTWALLLTTLLDLDLLHDLTFLISVHSLDLDLEPSSTGHGAWTPATPG